MKSLLLVAIALTLVSCGEDFNTDPADQNKVLFEKLSNVNKHVKLISPSITRSLDPSAFSERIYTIGHERRLLMKLVGLKDVQGEAVVNSENDAHIVIRPVEGHGKTLAEFETTLKICPLTQNWAVNATWEYYFLH
ncbi:MAG: hypothetical protein ACPGJV_05825 [Bacteriovoracaceae bacterium]